MDGSPCTRTKFVTVGGMIAADIHGKPPQEGSFGRYVDWIDVVMMVKSNAVLPGKIKSYLNGQLVALAANRCNFASSHPPSSSISAWINQKMLVACNIREAMNIFEIL